MAWSSKRDQTGLDAIELPHIDVSFVRVPKFLGLIRLPGSTSIFLNKLDHCKYETHKSMEGSPFPERDSRGSMELHRGTVQVQLLPDVQLTVLAGFPSPSPSSFSQPHKLHTSSSGFFFAPFIPIWFTHGKVFPAGTPSGGPTGHRARSVPCARSWAKPWAVPRPKRLARGPIGGFSRIGCRKNGSGTGEPAAKREEEKEIQGSWIISFGFVFILLPMFGIVLIS